MHPLLTLTRKTSDLRKFYGQWHGELTSLIFGLILLLSTACADTAHRHKGTTSAPINKAITATPVNDEVYVFLPFSPSAAQISAQLTSVCKDQQFTVFSNANHFRNTMSQQSPKALISVAAIMDHYPQLQITHIGTHNDNSEIPLYIVSINRAYNLKTLRQRRIGTIDLLGRQLTSDYVKNTLSLESIHVKRVSRVRDFLPLLTFEGADAILAPEHILTLLQERTRMPLYITPTHAHFGLTRVAVNRHLQHAKQTFDCLEDLDIITLKALGVDALKVRDD